MGRQGAEDEAERFAALFVETYLTFHRRTGPKSALSGPSRAILMHLAAAGPVTIGEAAQHFARAQSVVSEIVTRLERHGLLEREADPADRRRTLVWLTPEGVRAVREDQQVLDVDRLRTAIAGLAPEETARLLDAFSALLAVPLPPPPHLRKDTR